MLRNSEADAQAKNGAVLEHFELAAAPALPAAVVLVRGGVADPAGLNAPVAHRVIEPQAATFCLDGMPPPRAHIGATLKLLAGVAANVATSLTPT